MRLPHWFNAAAEVALIPINSCSCERVFSIYSDTFKSTQENALSDYREASVIIRYNKSKRNKKSVYITPI